MNGAVEIQGAKTLASLCNITQITETNTPTHNASTPLTFPVLARPALPQQPDRAQSSIQIVGLHPLAVHSPVLLWVVTDLFRAGQDQPVSVR